MKMERDLYISIGNSQIDFAIFENSIGKLIVHSQKTSETIVLIDILIKLNIHVQDVFVCSVVEKLNQTIKDLFVNHQVYFLLAQEQNLINLSKLDNSLEVGNDLIASAIYAIKIGNNITIVSLGSATVISRIVDQSLIGCIIFPGIEISYQSLTNLSGIKNLNIRPTKNILGTNTNDAVSIGILEGQKIMIEKFAQNFHTPNTIYLAYGGNLNYFLLPKWKEVKHMDLLGLYLYAQTIKNK